ncbi:putative Bromodomain testis-specific protein [Annulohypoxylon truncatum]|uniref:putative Bromodomain testis-specific protein n=1 Tax=Annulohypoxylon truncatum TaxID=327061 RepID=UPI002008A155|nr:putative Bromodomain testis-specific protein [Annulohypoxylon truncatum]KAI1204912.1 putative Bromodomain testis-specific protein [Annulohypoxylon truncatum]
METETGEVAQAVSKRADTIEPVNFSWLQPHVIFVVILVGEDEMPFGIQKDFLCAKSSFYRTQFADKQGEETENEQIEHVIRLPQATPEVFGFVQNFLYTGKLFTEVASLPGYEVLISTWKLGHELGIDGLCDEALDAMTECRRVTQHIPATPLLVQAWKDAPEGSSIRKLLLNWAAEYIRSSESRQEFTKSLPQEVLSELVIAMSHLNSSPVIQVNQHPSPTSQSRTKNVHYLEAEESDGESHHKVQKHRHSDITTIHANQTERKAGPKKSAPRASLPTPKLVKKRSSLGHMDDQQYSSDQKLNFCADLLSRMLSGPGFWTRLVGPFREPVRPIEDGVPDYLDVIKKPMDLNTVKGKMDRREYNNEQDFLADVRQIFTNCYTYHKQGSAMWTNCEKFQKTFEEKYGTMPKWISKMEGDEAA